MDILLISPVNSSGGLVASATVEVGFSGATPSAVEGGFVAMPDAPRPLDLRIRVTADSQVFFPVELTAKYSGNGHFDVTGPQEAFAPPRVALVDGNAAISLIAFVSRIRDATSDVLTMLQSPPANRAGYPLPPTFNRVNSTTGRNFLNDPPVAGGQLSFSVQVVQPQAEHVVFELKVATAPKLISVAWPDAVARSAGAPAPDVLVYFHPDVGQNVRDGYYLGAYPMSWDYGYFGIVTYEWYQGDPLLDNPYSKGVPFQLAAAGTKVVTVLPVNGVGPEIGVMRNADSMKEILLEIVGFMMRRRGVQSAPALGRIGLAAFSAANRHVTAFLRGNRANPFYLDVLKEVYAFEPPDDAVNPWLSAASAWLSSGSSADKMGRIYTQANPASDYARFLGRAINEPVPHFAASADGKRTASVTPIPAWARVRPGRTTGFQDCHQLISALLLTHAARLSQFQRV